MAVALFARPALVQDPPPAAFPPPAPDVSAWETVTLYDTPALAVRVRHRKVADLAQPYWIGFEFDNRTAAPIELPYLTYRTSCEQFDADTGQLLSSGSLASGDGMDLFGTEVGTNRTLPLSPGVTRGLFQPSTYSSCLLTSPHPPDRERRVEAKVHVLGLDSAAPGTAATGELTFRWRPLDDDGRRRARAMLRTVLANENFCDRRGLARCWLLYALFADERVAGEIADDELVRALARWPTGWERSPLQQYVDRRRGTTAAVIARYRELLRTTPATTALPDLAEMPHVWHEDFVEMLLGRIERATSQDLQAPPLPIPALARCAGLQAAAVDVELLFRHDATRPGSAASTRAAAALRRYADLLADPARPQWPVLVRALGQTRERDVVPLLRPFLELPPPAKLPTIPSGPVPPGCPRDHALEAIAIVLEGAPDALYERGPDGTVPMWLHSGEQMQRLRDDAVQRLRERLGR